MVDDFLNIKKVTRLPCDICMYVCMYVFMYVCVYVCMYAYMYACIRIYVGIYLSYSEHLPHNGATLCRHHNFTVNPVELLPVSHGISFRLR